MSRLENRYGTQYSIKPTVVRTYLLLFAFFLLLSGIQSGSLYAQGTNSFAYTIDELKDNYPGLEGYLLILPEDNRTYTVGEIAGQDPSVFMGYPAYQRKRPVADVYWSRLVLNNMVKQDLELFYYPGDRFTNRVDVYISAQGRFEKLTDGLYIEQSGKSYARNRNEINIPIRIPAGGTITLFSRIENQDGHAVNFDARLVRQQAWHEANTDLHWTQGIFHGILWVLLIYNLVLFAFLRRFHFLHYVGYAAAASLYFLNYYGIAAEYFFGGFPYAYITIYLVSTSLMPVFYLQFQRTFLNTYYTIPAWDIFMRMLVFLRVAEAMGMALIMLADFNFEFVQRIHRNYVYFEGVSFLIVLVGLSKTKHKAANFVIVGSLCLHLGLIISIFLIDRVSYGNSFFQLGVLAEVFLFSLAQIYQLRLEQEAKLKAEKASQAKAEFLSTMSHEIRTPLNAVIGSTHLLMQEDPRPDQVENLSTLKYSSETLLTLVNDILDFSKIEAGKVEFVLDHLDIRSFLESTHQSFVAAANEKELGLYLEIDERIPKTIHVDGSRLAQVLNNLLSNAIKFTKRGSITLEVKQLSQGTDEVSLEFSVVDTGVGIPRDKQRAIFDKFTQATSATTREYGGTGLGLAIIKHLLALQGVDIHLQSEVGKGSKFSFVQTFRYNEEALGRVTEVFLKPSFESLGNARILLVEDNPVNITMAQKFLTKWDLEVAVAKNGQEALDMLDSAPYDLILMDLQMPVMDGYTAAQEIRKFSKEIPILALTASALNEVREKVFRSGMNDFITKPFNPNDLYLKIRKYLGHHIPVKVDSSVSE